jgi:hypothetical protein
MHSVEGELITTDSIIVINDGFERFGDITAGEVVECGADYDISIPSDYPVNTSISFTLELSSWEGNWTIPFNIYVYPHPPEPCDQLIHIEGTGVGHSVEFSGGSRGAWNLDVFGSNAP